MAKILVSSIMVQTLEIPTYQLLTFGFGCCLWFAGLVLLIRQRQQGFFLSMCFLFQGVALTVEDVLITEVALLTIWPAFYLFTKQRLQVRKWHFVTSLHFLVPVLWGITRWLQLVAIEQWYESVAFLQFVPYIVLALTELYRQFRSRTVLQALQPAYVIWSFFGLLVILTIRLLLPLFPAGFSLLISLFYGLVGFYLLGLFSFSVHGPFRLEDWELKLEKEEATNYEEELKRRLEVLLKREKIFVIPDLTLQELSRKMQIRSAALSGFFSTSLGRNFNEVINEYRVEEVKRLMRDPNTDPKATLMELAYQSGFNSKATFNRIFKEMTGMTPKAFKTQVAE